MKKMSYLRKFAAALLLVPGLALAVPQPVATAPGAEQPFIGESFTLSVAFDNTDATDTGYGPFLDVVLPVNGADGVGGVGPDGISLVGSATYLGVPVTTISQTFPAAPGCVDHPYAVDNSGTPLQVCGAEGDVLVTIELPFGSFVPDQPPAAVDLNLDLSNLADLGTGLNIYSRAGFRFGADPLNNFTSDPSIVSDAGTDPATWGTQTQVTPRLIELTKTYIGPESETATGPNFPRQYTVTVDVAPGQVVTDLDVTDLLPNNMAFLSVISSNSSNGAGTVTSTPPVGVPANPTANELTVNFASVTGGTPVTVIFEYFIPRLDADNAVIIDASSGDDVISENQARAVGDWNPLDTRDAGATDNAVADPAGVEHTLTDKSIAIQKSVAIVNDTGALGEENPGDTLEYTLTFQVSDYFSFDDVVVTDVISDGQRFDSTFTPTLAMTRHGATSAFVPMGVFNFAASGDVDEHYTGAITNPVAPTDGTTAIRFRVSDELAARGDANNDSRLTGGCVPDGGTGSGNPADCSIYDAGATTATIVFRTVIQQEFSDTYPSGDASVDQGDVLTNDVDISGNLLSVEDNSTPTGNVEEDDSGAEVSIAYGQLSKSIYKVNGLDPVGNPITVQPGDTITYRLQYSMPTSDVENLVFSDYLPKPVLEATEVILFNDTATGLPSAGQAQYGPADTFGATHGGVYPGVPAISTNAQENSLTFTFGDYDHSDQAARNIDLLFTVTVNNEPFADALFLTNQVRVTQGSTNAGDAQADAIIQIQLQEPVLEITKGVSTTTNTASSITPVVTPVDGDLFDADAGDQVTFVITVENTGHAPAYDVLISDVSPAELTSCSLVSVVNNGTAEAGHTITQLLGSGITLTNALPAGAQALVTLTCDVANTVNPLSVLTNTASVEWRAEAGAGTAFTPVSDTADVTIAEPTVAKAITSVVPNGAGGTNVTAGDSVTYSIIVTVPEGVTQNLVLTDTLPAGFVYQTGSVSVIPGSFTGTLNTSPSVNVVGQVVTMDFGNVTATASSGVQDNQFTVSLQALVADVSANDGLPNVQTKTNRVELTCSTCTMLSDTATTSFAEPELQIVKSMTGPVDAGDTITVTLVIENTGTSPAYDITVSDVLNDSGNIFDLTSITEGTTPPGFTYTYANPQVTYTSHAGYSLAAGATATFTFTGTVLGTVEAGFVYDNTATVAGDGQDGNVTGERETTGNHIASVSIVASAVSKSIINSSESWTTPDASAAIGEILTYQLIFDIPEGVVSEDGTNAIITDQLPAGLQFMTGTALIRTNNVSNSLSGNIYGALPSSDTVITPAVSGSPELISFDLGSLTNSDSDGDTEQIIITYQALVLNTADNQRSATKTNTAALNYLNVSGNPQSTTAQAAATIVEPDLSVTKTAAPATVQGNDTVTFTVTISNPSGTDVTRVWDVTLFDALPARYDANYSLTSATLSRGNQDVTACGSFAGSVLSFDMATCMAASNSYLDPGDTIVLTYTADVDVAIAYEEDVTNTVTVAGTSLPGSNGTGSVTPGNPGDSDGERTGDTSGGAGAENDISATDSATVSAGIPTLTKTGNASLAIGDVTTMTIEVDVPVGSTSDFVITDDLPAGLSYTGTAITITTPSTDFSASNSPNTTPGAGTDPLVFDFGTISNTASTAQTITIIYEVQVDNVIANQRGTNLTNTATLSYAGGSASPSDSATVVVLEPDLEITKTITAGSTGSDAGDTISYQVVVSNTGNSTAFGVNLADQLPAELLGALDGTGSAGVFFQNITLNNPGNAVTVQSSAAPLAVADATFVTTTLANDTLTWPLFDLPAGVTLTITYDAVLHNSVVAGSTISNTAVGGYTSLTAAQGRDDSNGGDDDDDSTLNNYTESDAISFTVDSTINIQKNLNAAHASNDFTIGDLITFDVRVDLVEGITNSVVVTDTLPAGLVQVGDARIIAGNHISYTGSPDLSTLNWSMGNVTNTSDGNAGNDFFIIEVDARVQDVPGNSVGVTLTNSATVSSATGGPITDSTDVDIVEPNLLVTKTASDTAPSLGDVVSFTVTVAHDSSSADAYDVLVTDVIPAGMTYVPGSHTGDGSVDESNLAQPVFDLGTITLLDGSKTFTFNVTIDLDAAVGVAITNPVNLDYDGQSGTPLVERSYTDSDTEDVTPNVDAFIDAMKTVTLVVDGGTAGVVDPGDTLQYNITLTNQGDAVSNALFTDTMPVETTYVAGTLTTSKGTAIDSAAPTLQVNVGNMATSEVVTISFQVTVDAGTPAGTIVSNQGSVDSDQTVPEPTDEDGIDSNGDQPTDIPVGGSGSSPADLYTIKSVQWINDADNSGSITAGDRMRYLLTMENTGGVDLTNVSLTDSIPAGLTFVAGTESVSGAGNTISVVGPAVTVNVPSLTIGATVVIQFEVTIDAFVPATQTYVNQAATDSTQTGPDQSDGNGFPGDGNQPTSFTAVNGTQGTPALDLEKRVQLAVDADGDGSTDPGDTLLYTMTLTNTGSADAINVRIQDSIPANTTIVTGSAVTSQGVVVNENPININVGTLAASAMVTVQFRVTVDMATTNGTVLVNQATATADGGISEPSDDNGQDGDGKNPNLTPVHTHGGESPAGVPELDKRFVGSSETSSVAQNVLIGEVITYEIEARMPEGLLNAVSIIDTLPAGLRYLPGTARLMHTFETGLLSSANPGAINSAASGVFIALSDGVDIQISGGVITLDLGSVTNSDNDANDEAYVLQLQVVVENVAGNQEGVTLNNSAVISYLDGLGQSVSVGPESIGVTIQEPHLQVQKTASPVEIPPSGGSVNYTIVVSNPDLGNSAPAYDVAIADSLPAGFTAMTVDSIVPAGGVTGITDNSAGTTLDIAVDVLPVDATITINLTATAPSGLVAGNVLNNQVQVTGTSLPGPRGTASVTPGQPGDPDGERTGTGSVNDHVANDSAAVTVVGIDLELVKNVSNATPNVGDTLTFTLSLTNNGPSDATGVTVEDVVPDGYAGIANISPAGALAANTVTWNGLSVPVGNTVSLSFTAIVLESGTYLNTAEVTAANEEDTDSTPGNSDPAEDDQDSASVNPVPVGSIGNYVWHDDDGDGIQDAEEHGVAGVTVNLLDNSGTVVATTVTDGSGHYQFTDVVAGDYQVAFIPSSAYSFTQNDQGAGALQDAFDSDVAPATGITPLFTLGAGEDRQTLDAGLILNSGSPAAIGDRVWFDTNQNGIQDASEPGIAGVTVNLYDSSMVLIAVTVTDGNGNYEFVGLPAGDYVVEFDPPAGYSISPQNQGANQGLDSDADPVTGRTAPIALANGENNNSVDAGMVIPSVNPASIGDFVWLDSNGNGQQDAGEPGIAGLVVYLYDAADLDTPLASVITDGNGGYQFAGLPAGDYVVGFNSPAALTFTPAGSGNAASDSDADVATGLSPIISLSAGEAVTDVDAGLQPVSQPQLITIGDLVWLDDNLNGSPDAGEGLAGVEVVLYDAFANELARTTTDSNGAYSFTDLVAGDYRVEVDTTTLPVGVRQIADPDESGACSICDSASDQSGLTTSIDTVDFGYERIVDLSLTKTISSAPYYVGNTVTFTLTLSNAPGYGPATNISVTDIVPAGYSYAAGTIAGGDSSDDSNPAGSGLVWNINSLASGASVDLTFDAVINASGSYDNMAQVSAHSEQDVDSAPDNDVPAEDDQDHVVIDPNAVIDLSLEKTVSAAGTPNVGDIVTFTIVVANAGPSPATGVVVTDVVPSGYTYAGGIAGGDSVDDTDPAGSGLSWTIDSLDASANVTLSFNAELMGTGDYLNQAEITSAVGNDVDSTPGNGDPAEDDQDSASVTPPWVDLALVKSISPVGPHTVGQRVTFHLHVSNDAPYAATGVEVVDSLPDGYTDVGSISDNGTASGNTVTWSGLTIGAGGSIDLSLDAVITNTGDYMNVAQITSMDQTDIDSIPNNDDGDQSEDDESAASIYLAPVEVPTLSQWMLMLLSLLLAWLAATAYQRRVK